MVDMGMVNYTAKGSHGWYRRISKRIGVKVFERVSEKSLNEYLLTAYFGECCEGVKSVKVLGYGSGRIGILKAHDNGKNLSTKLRTLMYMEHIEGKTFEWIVDSLIAKAPIKCTTYTDKYDWAIGHKSIEPIMIQYNCAIKEIERLGLSGEDHRENLANFIIDGNNKLHVIDFSFEGLFLEKEKMKTIAKKMKHMLLKRLPEESYYNELVLEGFIRS
jgi:hypothetical protein